MSRTVVDPLDCVSMDTLRDPVDDLVVDLVDVPTAAQRLGVPVSTLYKRIERGKVRTQRVDGRVYVVVDRVSTPRDGLDSRGQRVEDTSSTVEYPSSTLVAHLQAEVTFLRGEVERRATAEAELRRLLAAALQQRALPAPAAPPSTDTSTACPWWAALLWWRR